MMDHFVNEYLQDDAATEEIVGVGWSRKFRKVNIIVAVCVVLFLVPAITSGNLFDLVYELAAVFLIVFAKIKKNSVIKTEKERLRVLCPDGDRSVRVEVGDALKVTAAKREKTISFSDVVKIEESKSFYILFIAGDMLAALKKDGFVEGDADACMAYLREQIAKK